MKHMYVSPVLMLESSTGHGYGSGMWFRDRALGSGSGMWHDFHLNAEQSPPLSRKSQFSGPKHWQNLQQQLGHGDISN